MAESKLLKTGKNYALGRKGQPLIVGSKKVSQDHCLFNVGEYTLDDVVCFSSSCLKKDYADKTLF